MRETGVEQAMLGCKPALSAERTYTFMGSKMQRFIILMDEYA